MDSDRKPLRERMLKFRKSLSEAERSQIFHQILQKFFSISSYQKSNNISAYYGKSASGEFDTTPLLHQILSDHKNLYLPRVNKATNQLNLYHVENIVTDLEPGVFGLIEPKINPAKEQAPSNIDLFIVPGLLFDRSGTRIGYGRGYYDSLLKNTTSRNTKVAFAYSKTIVSTLLKREPWDIPMDILISENEIIYCHPKKD